MTKQEKILEAIENIIDQFGDLRAEGITPDAWHRHMHELRGAAWSAYYAQKNIVKEQKGG